MHKAPVGSDPSQSVPRFVEETTRVTRMPKDYESDTTLQQLDVC